MRIVLSFDIAALKDSALSDLDAACQQFRSSAGVLTSISDPLFGEKLSESEMYLRNMGISAHEVPHLQAEAEVNGVTMYEQAAEIVSISFAAKELSAKIEKLRLSARMQITAADTAAEIESAKAVDWNSVYS